MSSALSQVTEALAARLGHAQAAKNMVILAPVDLVARGFLFERTDVKGARYLWRLVLPVFSPVMPSVGLNYSARIFRDYVHIFGNKEDIVNGLVEMLLPEQVQILDRCKTVAGFLSEFGSETRWRPNIALELAFAKLLAGDSAGGNELLAEVMQLSSANPILPAVQEHANLVAEASRRGPSALWDLANEIRGRNLPVLFPGLKE